jgi:hypothetical protein
VLVAVVKWVGLVMGMLGLAFAVWVGFAPTRYGFGYEPNIEWTSCGSFFLPENQSDPLCDRDSLAGLGPVALSLFVSVSGFAGFIVARSRLADRRSDTPTLIPESGL